MIWSYTQNLMAKVEEILKKIRKEIRMKGVKIMLIDVIVNNACENLDNCGVHSKG